MKKLLNAVLRCTNFGFGIAIGIGMGWLISSSHGPVQAGGNPFAALQAAIVNNASDIQDLQETSLTSVDAVRKVISCSWSLKSVKKWANQFTCPVSAE